MPRLKAFVIRGKHIVHMFVLILTMCTKPIIPESDGSDEDGDMVVISW